MAYTLGDARGNNDGDSNDELNVAQVTTRQGSAPSCSADSWLGIVGSNTEERL